MTPQAVTGVVAVPCSVQGRWSSFWACLTELQLPENVVIRTGRGCSPATNRNGLIEEAKKLGAQWIYFLDDDLTFHPDTLKRMVKHLDDPALECVVALSFRRQSPFRALWFSDSEPAIAHMMRDLPPPGALVPLKAATFGGLLIRMSAIAKIEPPYVALGQIHPDEWCDDIYFCRKLIAAGVKIWGDSSVRFGHTTDVEIWPYYDEANGWAVVFARGTEPFLMQPWGGADGDVVAGSEQQQPADVPRGT